MAQKLHIFEKRNRSPIYVAGEAVVGIDEGHDAEGGFVRLYMSSGHTFEVLGDMVGIQSRLLRTPYGSSSAG